MSILNYNGSALVAMTGQDCVAIASDRRYGVQLSTIATDMDKIFRINPHLYMGLPGLATDAQTVHDKMRYRVNLYELRENRRVSPNVLANMLSNLLYEKRFSPFFVEPIVAGLDYKNDYKPYVCNMDLIGCLNEPEDFVVGGSASSQLFGMCETVWEKGLDADALFETCSQALINAFDRDAISGWGAVVYILEKNKVTVKELKTRQD